MKECWCIPPKQDAAFVAAMEDVLEVYQRPRDEARPLVCLDEFCKQLVEESRTPLPMAPGRPARHDYEYVRRGSASAFVIHAPLEGSCGVHIGPDGRRTAADYARALEYIAEVMYPGAERIVLVEDNLNTHGDASLYATFEPEKARALAEKFERHHTPKHGSWLNMAEIEISALTRTALPERIGSLEEFRERCRLAVERRNAEGRHTVWQFTNHDARIKLRHLYPSIQGG